MISETILSVYLSLTPVKATLTDFLPPSFGYGPQRSMPSLEGLDTVVGETYTCKDRNHTKITMKKYYEKHPTPECEGHLKYITATREGKNNPYCIYDGINHIMYLDNGILKGKPEDKWMDEAYKCLPGEKDAASLIPTPTFI